MVSAAKMRKAIASVLAIRPYAHSAWSVLTNMARAFENYETPLLAAREVKKICIVLVSSNRGLCGGFNSQLLRKVIEQVKKPTLLKVNRAGDRRIESSVPDEQIEIDFITVGKKGSAAVRKLGKNIIATFDDLTYLPASEDVRPLARLVIDEYKTEKYDKAVIVFTDYISAVQQSPKFRQLLPISKVDLEKQLADMDMLAEEFGLKQVLW